MRVKLLDSVFGCAAVLALATIQPLSAQYGASVPIQHPSETDGITGHKDEDVITQHMAAELAKARNKQRQQQLVADTEKLLGLATQLKDDVDKSNKDTLSLDVIKKAEEIEKLAKSVKEKMRNGF
jgi:nitric oxide reductase activation protein